MELEEKDEQITILCCGLGRSANNALGVGTRDRRLVV